MTSTNESKAHLFGREAREIPLPSVGEYEPAEDSLLWVDMAGETDATLGRLWQDLRLPGEALAIWRERRTAPLLGKSDGAIWLQAFLLRQGNGSAFASVPVMVVASSNTVVTLHDEALEELASLKRELAVEREAGTLTAEHLTAFILDRQIGTYFHAVSAFESEVEWLEEKILDDEPRDCLPDLRRLCMAASSLRRTLALHRAVYSELARPGFHPGNPERVQRGFRSIDERFERALDMAENARDLVMESFGLFSAKTSLDTNNSMQVLTFATVVVGSLSVIAGWLGMNFLAHFYTSGEAGFAIAVLGSIALALSLVMWARHKRWL